MTCVWKSAIVGLGLAASCAGPSLAADMFQQGPLRRICDRAGDCIVKFDAIPRDQLWVVNQVSCWWGMTTGNETKVVSVSLGYVDKKGRFTDAVFLGAPQMVSFGPTSAAFALMADARWRMGEGNAPGVRFSIESAGENVGFNSLCSISGTKPN
jgi:hypothetical protein